MKDYYTLYAERLHWQAKTEANLRRDCPNMSQETIETFMRLQREIDSWEVKYWDWPGSLPMSVRRAINTRRNKQAVILAQYKQWARLQLELIK